MTRALVAGVGARLPARLSVALAAEPAVERVVGIDAVLPERYFDGVGFVRADPRGARLAEALESVAPDVVVQGSPAPDLLATMQLLDACQRSDAVRRVVVVSSTAVYGTSPNDPAVFTEETPARSVPAAGPARAAVEVEATVRGFVRRRPDVAVTVLRFAEILGPSADSPLARYLALPVVPVRLGVDPRLQFLHEDDALAVLCLAALADHPGTFNVAGDGVLLLSQALRRARRLALRILRRDPGPLGQGRVVDTARLRERFGYTPRFTTAGAYATFVEGRHGVGGWHG